MALLLRTRTAPITTPVATFRPRTRVPLAAQVQEQTQEEEVAAPVRRLRLTSNNTAASRAALQAPVKLQIDEELKSIAKAERAIDDATVKMDASYAKIDELMRSVGLVEHTNGVHIARIEEQVTKQQRIIDPMKFKNAVPNKVFWKSVSVSIKDALEFLTDSEVNAIAEHIAGKKIGDVLKIKRLPIKSRTR